jgi:hypothetical protein
MFKEISLFVAIAVVSGCSVSAHNEASDKNQSTSTAVSKSENIVTDKNNSAENASLSEAKSSAIKNSIVVTPKSPAASVRTFYKALREKRFFDAMLMTNLKNAVEGLSTEELEDLRPYFEALAADIPEEVEVNGEQTVGTSASVFAKLPDEQQKFAMTELKLRFENDGWTLLLVDEKTESEVKKAGKNYLFNLRVEIHQSEAEEMFDRIQKAEYIYSIQNKGECAEMGTLVSKGLLPMDVQTPESTGYRFAITVSNDKKRYVVTAEPEKYGKSGKLSYFFDSGEKNSKLKSSDNKGMPIKK